MPRRLSAMIFSGLLALPVQAQDRKTVPVGELTVSCGDAGTGQPVILLHGGGLSSAMWRWFAPVAAENFRVLTPDTRGHGQTDNPSGAFSYDLTADDVAGFIAALGLEQPFVVGYSDGGITALTFLMRHPGLARAAVIGGATHKVAADAHYAAGMQAFFGYNTPGALPDIVMDGWIADQPDTIERYRKVHGTAGNPDRWRELYASVWPTWTTPLVMDKAALQAVSTPTLVVLAQNDEFFTPDQATELASLLGTTELAVLPDLGHTVFRDDPDQFNAVVLEFLLRQ